MLIKKAVKVKAKRLDKNVRWASGLETKIEENMSEKF